MRNKTRNFKNTELQLRVDTVFISKRLTVIDGWAPSNFPKVERQQKKRYLGKPMVFSSVWYAIQYLRHCPAFPRVSLRLYLSLSSPAATWRTFFKRIRIFWRGWARFITADVMTCFPDSFGERGKNTGEKLLVSCHIRIDMLM